MRASWEEWCLLYGPVWKSTVIAALLRTGGLWHISKPNQQRFTFPQEEFRLDARQVWMQEVPSKATWVFNETWGCAACSRVKSIWTFPAVSSVQPS